MIKVSEHIYIHWLTVALFACCYITRSLEFLASVYSVMLLHELSHALAAIYLRVGISRIVLYPFGVNLKIKTRLLSSLSDEAVLYLSGPLVNAVFALIFAVMGKMNTFYYNNLLVFVINLLPVMPLDGGQLAKRIFSSKLGERRAGVFLSVIGTAIGVILLFLIVKFGGVNINSITFCVFIIVSVFTQKEKYNRDFVRELACIRKRKPITVSSVIIADIDADKVQILKNVVPSRGAVVYFTDENSKIVKAVTDRELANEILS